MEIDKYQSKESIVLHRLFYPDFNCCLKMVICYEIFRKVILFSAVLACSRLAMILVNSLNKWQKMLIGSQDLKLGDIAQDK